MAGPGRVHRGVAAAARDQLVVRADFRRPGRRRRRRSGPPSSPWSAGGRSAPPYVGPAARRAPPRSSSPTARSRLEVASSSTSTRGCARNARASAISWRSPEDSDWPALVDDRCRARPASARRRRRDRPPAPPPTPPRRRRRAGEGDVVAQAAGEQERLLRHDAQLTTQRVERHVAQIVAVDQHAALGRVVEARDQLRQSRFARAGLADERDRLAGRDAQVDVA